MKPYKNLSNLRFDKLMAVEMIERKNKRTYWKCLCDCGNEIITTSDSLVQGKITSCGCKKLVDITGKRYGKLEVLGQAEGTNSYGMTRWHVKCDCGNDKVVLKGSLTSGNTKSCGNCPKPEKPKKERISYVVPHLEDIKGCKFSRITPVEYIGNRKWRYVCECGGEGVAERNNITSGNVQACVLCRGSLRSERHIKDIAGQQFGDLLVLHIGERRSVKSEIYWLCRCKCGKEYEVRGSHLRSGSIKMCRSCRGLADRVETPVSGYPADFSLRLRTKIRKRDEYICQYCKQQFGIGGLDIHHIDHDRSNNDPMNLVSLCNKCHYKMHCKDANEWIPYWKSFMIERFPS